MIPVRMDFQTWTNADHAEEFQFVADGEEYNITGMTLDMEVRLFPTSAAIVFALATVTTNIQGLRVIDAANGIISVRINRATLQTAYNAVVTADDKGSVFSFSYDLRLTHSDGFREIALQGLVVINPGITLS